MADKEPDIKGLVKSLGLVFGDIGTSPIYTFTVVIDVDRILKEAGITEKVMFYGLDNIVTRNPIWRLFSFIKRLSPAPVQFYKLPSQKLHGVITSVEM